MHASDPGLKMDTLDQREHFYVNHTCFPTTDQQAAQIGRVQWLRSANEAEPFRRVLDIGCHDGFVTRWLLGSPFLEKLLGIDLCAHAIRCAWKLSGAHPKVEYRELRFTEVTPGLTFDTIVAFELIEHLDDADARQLVQSIN